MRAALLAALMLLPLAMPAEARAPIPLEAKGLALSPTNPLPGDLTIADLCSGLAQATIHLGQHTQVLSVAIALDPDPCAGGAEAFTFTLANAGAGLDLRGAAAFTRVDGAGVDLFDAAVTGTYFGRAWLLADSGPA